MNAIEQIRQAETAAKLQAVADYEALAERLAKGEPLPVGVLTVLVAANKTADDLEKAVNVAAERHQLKPLADALPQILTDRAQAEAELKAADEAAAGELDAVREKLTRRLAPLHQRVADLREAEAQSRAAKGRLFHLTAKPTEARKFNPAAALVVEEE